VKVRKVPAVTGADYQVIPKPDGSVVVSRRSNSIHLTRQDISNVFAAIYEFTRKGNNDE
jgi:hypothetical protein